MKKKLKFEKVSSVSILKILKEFKTSKVTGVDNLAGKFLKNGSNILCTPIAKISNLSIKLASFPDKCKVAKIKVLIASIMFDSVFNITLIYYYNDILLLLNILLNILL